MGTLLAGMTLVSSRPSVSRSIPERQARTTEFFIVAKGKPRTSPVN